ncbi:MAG: hypothetical protein DI570_25655 [Phenylobacterium zucineum]|nr:MAG: hypothetical protein DI570_25655 [Phenylobacterium zucineum]
MAVMNVVRYPDQHLVQLQDDDGKTPPIVGHLNYQGELDPSPVGRLVGPTEHGLVAAVEARYDQAADRTRVGFAALPLEGSR